MVELRVKPYESGDKEYMVQEAGFDITAGTVEADPELTCTAVCGTARTVV